MWSEGYRRVIGLSIGRGRAISKASEGVGYKGIGQYRL